MNHLSPATPGTLRERFVQDMTVRGFTDKARRRTPHPGSALTHHPHIHMIVPGGGISLDGPC